MSKLLLFVGGVIAMGLTWLLVLIWAASALFSREIEGTALGILAVTCFALATYPSWKLFVKPDQKYR